MTTGHESEAATRLAAASRVARAELDKQGTPDYDPRAHERAVEFERKAADALRAARAGTS
ncbi:translation initiation factor 2 [Cellulomonas sp. NS3]|uniref:translation initiation factor 2 n=1 Tax=Cellulomonas sp. NS3 TaxID=2973977 RepID=UPI002161AC26|nr:translation initiation factor 2 [Cellulomonas sp. NS3]